MTKITHKKGKHGTNIFTFLKMAYKSMFKKSIIVKFTKDSKYDLKDDDQYDWNKIVGRGSFKFKKINGNYIRKEEEMLVWRYNIEKDVFEVTYYWRNNYDMSYERNYFELKENEEAEIKLDLFDSFIPTSAYFGGNEEAPKDVTYYVK